METATRSTSRQTRTRPRSSAITRVPWRGSQLRFARSSLYSTGGGAAEQAVGPPDQDHDHDSVDHEWSKLRHVVFAGNIANAEQQRCQERSGNAGGAADSHHDQKVDHELQREIRIESQNLRAERAAETGETTTECESKCKHLRHIDAEPARRTRIVYGGPQPAAEAGARQNELQCRREQAADHDDHQPVAADADTEEIDLPLERFRDFDENPRRSHDVIHRRHRHEYESDAEQHLIEMAAVIEVAIK